MQYDFKLWRLLNRGSQWENDMYSKVKKHYFNSQTKRKRAQRAVKLTPFNVSGDTFKSWWEERQAGKDNVTMRHQSHHRERYRSIHTTRLRLCMRVRLRQIVTLCLWGCCVNAENGFCVCVKLSILTLVWMRLNFHPPVNTKIRNWILVDTWVDSKYSWTDESLFFRLLKHLLYHCYFVAESVLYSKLWFCVDGQYNGKVCSHWETTIT